MFVIARIPLITLNVTNTILILINFLLVVITPKVVTQTNGK